jgi:hypothetical protein
MRNTASERRSAPKISTSFAAVQRCTRESLGAALTSKGPRLMHKRGLERERGYSSAPSDRPIRLRQQRLSGPQAMNGRRSIPA